LHVVLIRFASSKPNSPIFLLARVPWKLLPLLFHVRQGQAGSVLTLEARLEIVYSVWFVVCIGELAVVKLEIQLATDYLCRERLENPAASSILVTPYHLGIRERLFTVQIFFSLGCC
jgi:hypothetical protein